MTELSTAAQAVMNATDYPEDWATRVRVAAALRAAADQVVPVENANAKMFQWQRERLEQRLITRQALIAIAKELES